MKSFFRNLSLSFAAGTLGGLANGLVVWVFGILGITAALGVKAAPVLTPVWLYPRLVWGGLWGFLFLLPFLKKSPISRGIIYSLGPTFAQLFLVFPLHLNQGIMGMKLGVLMPLFVVFFNIVWGVVTSLWLSAIEETPSIWRRKR